MRSKARSPKSATSRAEGFKARGGASARGTEFAPGRRPSKISTVQKVPTRKKSRIPPRSPRNSAPSARTQPLHHSTNSSRRTMRSNSMSKVSRGNQNVRSKASASPGLRYSSQSKLGRSAAAKSRMQSSPRITGGTPRRRSEVPVRARRNSAPTSNHGATHNRAVGPRSRIQQPTNTRQPINARGSSSSGSNSARIRRSRTAPGQSHSRSAIERRRSVPRIDGSMPLRQKKKRILKSYSSNPKAMKERSKRPAHSYKSARVIGKIESMKSHLWSKGDMQMEF